MEPPKKIKFLILQGYFINTLKTSIDNQKILIKSTLKAYNNEFENSLKKVPFGDF